MIFRPKYITFDCYGTLTYFRMHEMALDMYEGQLPTEQLRQFVRDFNAYRLDEVMGDWKPYADVLKSALERACRRHGLKYRDEDGQKYYDASPNQQTLFLTNNPPFTPATTPSRAAYEALIAANAYNIIVEDSTLERWAGNFWVRTTKYVKAQ